jgi:hypothetical protein
MRLRWTLVLSAATACSAAAAALAGPLPAGVWGSAQGNFTVYADSATLDMPCAAGRIPSPIVTDSSGAFDIAGFYAPQVGPVSIDGPAWQPARFVANRSGDELTLTIVRASGDSIGSLKFHRGTTGQFARCL